MQEPKSGSGSEAPAGGGPVVVRAGECIFSLADRHGFHWETIWQHAENSELREARGSPHVLKPGDRVFIPERTIKDESRSTEAKHRFRKKGVPIEFQIEVLENDEPRDGVPYTLKIESREESGRVPSDGLITIQIYPGDQRGELRVGEPDDERVYPIRLGGLDPAHTQRGAAQRLMNMGLLASATPRPKAFKFALTRFQGKHDLERTGELDETTSNKLAEVHGS